LIDQRLLPGKFVLQKIYSLADTAKAIKTMVVRGAPAIGAAGAYGMVFAGQTWLKESPIDMQSIVPTLERAKSVLDAARPTAVNLMWATKRLLDTAKIVSSLHHSPKAIVDTLLVEANRLCKEDIEVNLKIARAGAQLVRKGSRILHHCNTGALATVDIGTALGVVYEAHKAGKDIRVWVDESRPRLQGARLTAWELTRAGVPCHLIVDSAAGSLMRAKKVDVILFGADRVAKNGDVANKIGTYQISVLGRENKVPVYAVVPTSTIDLDIAHGDLIKIEERPGEEVTNVLGTAQIAPKGVKVFNPAFDVTPHRYITAIITEEGVCYPPFEESLAKVKAKAQARILKAQEQLRSRLTKT